MNERLALLPNNQRIFNDTFSIMHHHDQSKLNESIYHSDSRYTIDDRMIDELITADTESLNDLTHLESALNKAPIMSSNTSTLMMNEDYFNHYPFNQMPNIISNSYNMNHSNSNLNNSNVNLNNGPNSSHQYNYHNLQAPAHNNTVYNQYIPASNLGMNSSYLTLGPAGNSGSLIPAQISPTANANGMHYASKIVSRTPSFNSSSVLSSSPSSSTSSTLSIHLPHQQAQINNISHSISTSNDQLDYEQSGELDTSTQSNDPAEMARLKQMRGAKLTQEEIQLLVKDRQRKDNHNMIERRRRFNINDRIKELGQLLPKNGEFDTKQNKGSILKASVDYITQIRSEIDDAKKIQETNKYLLTINKKLLNKIKELEMICRSNGFSINSQLNNANNYNYIQVSNKLEHHNPQQVSNENNYINKEQHINSTYTNMYDPSYNPNSDFNSIEKKDFLNTPELGKEHLNENDKLDQSAKLNDTDNNPNKAKADLNAAKKPRGQTRKRKSADAKIDEIKVKHIKKADDVAENKMSESVEEKNLKEEPISPRLTTNQQQLNIYSAQASQTATQESVPLQDQSNTTTDNNNNSNLNSNYDNNVLTEKSNSEKNSLVDENKIDTSKSSDIISENLENTNKPNTDLNNINNNEQQKLQASTISNTPNKNENKPQPVQTTPPPSSAPAPSVQPAPKYIITKITTNRINPSLVQNKLNFNFNASESLNSPSNTSVVSSNTPLVKLMTSYSKDPILASSSVSSPVPSPSTSTSSLTSSSCSASSSSSNQQSCTSSPSAGGIDCQPCMQIPCLVNNNHGY